MTTTRVRISATALEHLSGSQAWHDRDRTDTGEETEVLALFRRLADATARADGSVRLDLTPAEAAILLDYVEAWAGGARDSLDGYSYPGEGLGELNAARSLARHLAAAAAAK